MARQNKKPRYSSESPWFSEYYIGSQWLVCLIWVQKVPDWTLLDFFLLKRLNIKKRGYYHYKPLMWDVYLSSFHRPPCVHGFCVKGNNYTGNFCICQLGWCEKTCNQCIPYWECPNQSIRYHPFITLAKELGGWVQKMVIFSAITDYRCSKKPFLMRRALVWLNLYGREAVWHKLKNRQKIIFVCVFRLYMSLHQTASRHGHTGWTPMMGSFFQKNSFLQQACSTIHSDPKILFCPP